MIAERRRVLLLLETSRAYGRGLLQGIAFYAQAGGPWSFGMHSGDASQELTMDELKGYDGIIGRVKNPAVLHRIGRCGIPLVALDISRDWPGRSRSFSAPPTMIARILADREEGCRMVLEHFVHRGFRHVAFCGYSDALWSRQRQEKFCELVRSKDLALHCYSPPRLKRQRLWPNEEPFLVRWLASLPKPVGVMACNDDRGRKVIDACTRAHLQVPYEVALVGVDNDELICNLISPALSSVALNTRQAGYEAAAVLHRAMAGDKIATGIIPVHALRLIARQSSDVLAIYDRAVAQALQFITTHAHRPVGVEEVVAASCLSRRVLEGRFRRRLGHSILQEIRHMRIEQAVRLLLESNLSISQIAVHLKYSNLTQLIRQFQKEKQTSPQAYRSQYGHFSDSLRPPQGEAPLLRGG